MSYPHWRCHWFMRRWTLAARPILSTMVLSLVALLWLANRDTTSLGRRERVPPAGEGGARRDRAASTGGAESDTGVSQNMYMKPGSSELRKGRASSVIKAEAVGVSSESGIKSLTCPV